MKEYVLDIVCNRTYGCVVNANSLEEAENKARLAYALDRTYIIDEGIISIDLIEEKEIE